MVSKHILILAFDGALGIKKSIPPLHIKKPHILMVFQDHQRCFVTKTFIDTRIISDD